jgi:hypothetical protein
LTPPFDWLRKPHTNRAGVHLPTNPPRRTGIMTLKIKFTDGKIVTTKLYANDTVLRLVVNEVCMLTRRNRADVVDYWTEAP